MTYEQNIPLQDRPPIEVPDDIRYWTIDWFDHEHMLSTYMVRGSGYSGDYEETSCILCRVFSRKMFVIDYGSKNHPPSCYCGDLHPKKEVTNLQMDLDNNDS